MPPDEDGGVVRCACLIDVTPVRMGWMHFIKVGDKTHAYRCLSKRDKKHNILTEGPCCAKLKNDEKQRAQLNFAVLGLKYKNANPKTGKYSAVLNPQTGQKEAPPITWELGWIKLSQPGFQKITDLMFEGETKVLFDIGIKYRSNKIGFDYIRPSEGISLFRRSPEFLAEVMEEAKKFANGGKAKTPAFTPIQPCSDLDLEGHTDLPESDQEGNCFPAHQFVISPQGLLTVGETFESVGQKATCTTRETPTVIPLYNQNGKIEATSSLTHNGRRGIWRLKTRSGGEIEATANQPLSCLNKYGWTVKKKMIDVRPGDYLMVQRAYEGDVGERGTYPENALYLFGVMIADAYFGDNRIVVTNDDPVVKQAIVKHGGELFGKQPLIHAKEGNTGSVAYQFNSKEKASEIYHRLGWEPCVASGKKLGRYIRGLDRDGMAAVLQGFFDCECSITAADGIDVVSASWTLLHEVKLALLVHFGIVSILTPKFVATYPDTAYWTLNLYGGAAESYIRQVGFRSEIRKERAKTCLGKCRNPNVDVVPHLGHFLTAIHEGSNTTREHVTLVRDYKGDDARAEVTYQRLGRILAAEWTNSPALDRLHEIYEANYYYDEVVKVEEAEGEPTFDFTMPATHSLIVNGFVARNSDDRVAASAAATA